MFWYAQGPIIWPFIDLIPCGIVYNKALSMNHASFVLRPDMVTQSLSFTVIFRKKKHFFGTNLKLSCQSMSPHFRIKTLVFQSV